MATKKDGYVLYMEAGPGGCNVLLYLVCGDLATVKNGLARFLDSALERSNSGLLLSLYFTVDIFLFVFKEEKVIQKVDMRPYIKLAFDSYEPFMINDLVNQDDEYFFLTTVEKKEKVRINREDFIESIGEDSGKWQWNFEISWDKVDLKNIEDNNPVKEGDIIYIDLDEEGVDVEEFDEEDGLKYGVTDHETGLYLATVKPENPYDFTDAVEIW